MPKTANAKKIDKNLSKKPLPVKQEKPPKNVKVKHAPPISSKDIIAKAEANAPKPLKSGPAPNAVAKKAVVDSSSTEDSSSSESESDPQPSKKVAQQAKTNGKSAPSKKLTPTHVTVNAKTQKRQEASSSDSSSDSDSSDDDSAGRDEPKESAPLIEANGTSKSTKPDSGSEDESSEDSSDESTTGKKTPVTQKATANDNSSDSDDSTSEDEKSKSQQIKSLPQPSAHSSTEESSSSSEDSKSDSDSDIDASPKTPAFASKKVQSAKDSSSDTDASSGEGSSDSGSDEDVEMEIRTPAAVVTGKRKAEESPALAVKKPKINGSIAGTKPDDNSTKTIFVGNLSWTVDNDRLSQEFADCGEVISARVQLDRNTGKSRGFGFVTFATTEAVEAAVTLNGTKEIDGRVLNLDKTTENGASREKRAQAFGDTRSAPSKVLFVGNLSWNTVEDTIWDAFSEYGEVASVRIPTDKESGKPKGYGYVEFGTVDSAQKAIDAMNGKEVDGRSIRLDFTQPRDTNGAGPGRGAGFAGGRGRGGFDGGRGRGGFDRGRGRGGFDRGRGRGGGGGRGGDRGRGRGGARGGMRFGAIAASEGQKITF